MKLLMSGMMRRMAQMNGNSHKVQKMYDRQRQHDSAIHVISYTIFLLFHFVDNAHTDGHGNSERQYIGNRLTDLNAQKAKIMGQYEDKRNEAEPLPCGGNDGGLESLSDGLQHHVAHDDPCV